jgi:predicted amidophosphoribosyltransferase
VNNQLVARINATQTQTRKSRFSRYQNVQDIFTVNSPEAWKGKHLLLVDDVITTGATIESCVQALQVIPNVRISVACIATALI